MTWEILLFQAVSHNICPWIHPAYVLFGGEMGSLGVCVAGWERENDKVCLHVPGKGHRNEISRSHAKKEIPLTYFRADA